MDQRRDRNSSGNGSSGKTAALILLAVLLLINIFLWNRLLLRSIPDASYPDQDVPPPDQGQTLPDQPSTPIKEQLLGHDYKSITASPADTASGYLILVNTEHPYVFDNQPVHTYQENLVSVYSYKTRSYKVKDINVKFDESAMEPLNAMMDAFYAETGLRDVLVTSAYRSADEQDEVLEQKIGELGEHEGKLTAMTSGASEHHTGYALDFTRYSDSGVASDFDGTGEYGWFYKNADRYGFILRYPETKTEITGIKYEPWHFRYVGKPHAYYITQNNLTLEEYIDLLADHPFEGEHLVFSDDEGTTYEIYTSTIGQGDTDLPVPKSVNTPYTLSGDNCGHVVVTVVKDADVNGSEQGTVDPTDSLPEDQQ